MKIISIFFLITSISYGYTSINNNNNNTENNMTAVNFTTEKAYSSANSVQLLQSGRSTNQWATYRQFQAAGYQVRKGEKGTRLVRVIEREDKHGNIKKSVKSFVVFNLDQVDKIEQDAA